MSQSDATHDTKPPAGQPLQTDVARTEKIEQLAARKFARSRMVAGAAIALSAAAVIGVLALIVTLW